MRKLTASIALILLMSAAPVLAQSTDVQAQIAALLQQLAVLQQQLAELQGTSGAHCVDLTHNMGPGDTDADTGGEVSKLQQFLVAQGLMSSSLPRGYFGPVTMRAVQQWQSQKGIVSSGAPDTTGYGFVGPKTRAAMACKTTPPPPTSPSQSCTFSGQTVQSGSSVTAYQSSSVASGSQCVSQTRTCSNATLSGSYAYSSCVVGTASNCTWNGQTVANGASITAYQSSSVANGSQCVSQARTCANGTLSGSYQYASCSVATAASCTFNGQTVASGNAVTAYQSASVAAGSQCVSQTRTCSNGTLSGSYAYASCVVGAAATVPIASPAAGTYALARPPAQTYSIIVSKDITLSANATTSIRYTLDGATPTCTTGSLYAGPIKLTSSKTIKAIGCNGSGSSSVMTAAYNIIPNGWSPTNITAQWSQRMTLLYGFTNMYNPDVHYDPSDTAYPYKMWFFGWANAVGNSNLQSDCHVYEGRTICGYNDAIFYARSSNGNDWQVYAGGGSVNNPTFDSTMNPSLWRPVLRAQENYYDGYNDGDPSVVKVGNTWYMAYSATGPDRDGIDGGDSGDTDDSFNDIMGAFSTDGINWHRTLAPLLSRSADYGAADTLPYGNYGNYHRPSLLYDNGTFKLWFDYWHPADTPSMGYAEFPLASPTGEGFRASAGHWTLVRSGDNAAIVNFSNPAVVKVGNMYYAYGDPAQTYDPSTMPNHYDWRQITEASSPDGVNWTVRGYIKADSDCDANWVPQAYALDGRMYLTYGCLIGGWQKKIRRMSKPISEPTPMTITPLVVTTNTSPITLTARGQQSNDVHDGLPALNAIDGNVTTVYSSNSFTTNQNDRGAYLAAWVNNGPRTVSRVVLTPRMVSGAPTAFPRQYIIFLTNPGNTGWVSAGSFTQQPVNGVATIDLGQSYSTWGVKIQPTLLATDSNGTYYFQLAEVGLR